MTHKEMMHLVKSQLAVDLNCSVTDLEREEGCIVFVEAKDNPGRRPFPRGERYFEITSMGKSIVVSATPERLSIARAQMEGKDRDAIFALPFIRGLYLHYVPDLDRLRPLLPPAGFTFELVEQDQVSRLLETKGFNNALIYNVSHPYHTVLAILARNNGEIVGMAGACDVCLMWRQMGVDVLPLYRNHGLASYMVNSLALRILDMGHVPVYDALASNIASQRVAHRAGFIPAWVSDWRCNFEGLETR